MCRRSNQAGIPGVFRENGGERLELRRKAARDGTLGKDKRGEAAMVRGIGHKPASQYLVGTLLEAHQSCLFP